GGGFDGKRRRGVIVGKRDDETENGAALGGVDELQLSAEMARELMTDREADAAVAGLGAEQRAEKLTADGGREAGALVGDFEEDRRAVDAGAQRDGGVRWRGFEGVTDEVEEDEAREARGATVDREIGRIGEARSEADFAALGFERVFEDDL